MRELKRLFLFALILIVGANLITLVFDENFYKIVELDMPRGNAHAVNIFVYAIVSYMILAVLAYKIAYKRKNIKEKQNNTRVKVKV